MAPAAPDPIPFARGAKAALPTDADLAARAPNVLWWDTPMVPAPRAPLDGDTEARLVVVGAGFTGLWAAIAAAREHGVDDVVLIDRSRVGWEASGRNGGFCSASLTHGLRNGLTRFGREVRRLHRLGNENLAAIVDTIAEHRIDCGLVESGQIEVAVAPWLVAGCHDTAELLRSFGEEVEVFDRSAMRELIDSPTYHGGIWQRTGEVLVDPARLSWGLAEVAEGLGVRIFENTPMVALDRITHGAGTSALVVHTPTGSIRCSHLVSATNAFGSPLPHSNRRVVPVYDYVLATEPLSPEQLGRIGWERRQGVSDTTNQFHYYRLTPDDRILWGGYDAVFYTGGRIGPGLEARADTHLKLAGHFRETFPQLDDVSFTHRWAGVIDTSTRFAVGFGTGFDGRVAAAVGYTGLGVGASRFGGRVAVDLLLRPDSELCDLELVRRSPLPFPPEPFRSAGIQLTRHAIAQADRRKGRRGVWLRLLDRVGLGFDS